jgi:hypothetical protein
MTKLQDLNALLEDLNALLITNGSKTILKLSFAYDKIGVLRIDPNGNVLDQLRSHCYTKNGVMEFLQNYRLGVIDGLTSILNSNKYTITMEDQK